MIFTTLLVLILSISLILSGLYIKELLGFNNDLLNKNRELREKSIIPFMGMTEATGKIDKSKAVVYKWELTSENNNEDRVLKTNSPPILSIDGCKSVAISNFIDELESKAENKGFNFGNCFDEDKNYMLKPKYPKNIVKRE